MKHLSLLLVAVLAILSFSTNVTADDHRRVDLGGTIAAVGDGGIVLHLDTRRHDRRNVRIRVFDRTRIFRNGHPARLADLHVGDSARVRAIVMRTRDGVAFFALEIQARGDGR